MGLPQAGRSFDVGWRFALALAAGSAGGFLFWTLHAPLPWMLGPMLACGVGALLKLPISAPASVRPPMSALIGTMLGTSFGAGTFARAAEWLVPIAGVAGLVLTAGMISYLYFRHVGGLDHVTAFFSGMPGGLVDMALLGGERGGDDRMIALIHAARIFVVVLLLPFLVQATLGTTLPRASANPVPLSVLTPQSLAWFTATLLVGVAVGKVLRLPARYMFGPLLVSGLVHFFSLTDFRLPSVMIFGTQAVIGTMIGCRFAGTPPRRILTVIALSLGYKSRIHSPVVLEGCEKLPMVGQPVDCLHLRAKSGEHRLRFVRS